MDIGRKIAVMLTFTGVALGVAVAPSEALTRYWNSKSAPLTARNDPDNAKNVYFELRTYVNAGYCASPDYLACEVQYYAHAQQFSDFTKQAWHQDYWSPQMYASTSLPGDADKARAGMRAGESNWGPDTLSGTTWTKGNNY